MCTTNISLQVGTVSQPRLSVGVIDHGTERVSPAEDYLGGVFLDNKKS